MAKEAAIRTYNRIHHDRPYHDGKFQHWAAEASEATPFHANDGVRIFVAEADLNPTDHFLTAPRAFAPEDGAPDPE